MVLKRRTVHLGFAVIAVICAAMAAYQGIGWYQRDQVNRALSRTTLPGAESPSKTDAPQVVLAQALALSRAGDVDKAARFFAPLIARTPPDASARAALYDLANLYLRKGASLAEENATAALPYIELAKQRYRDLLRIDPEQWDARYNLERALRLAPEAQAVFNDVSRSTEHRPNIKPRDDVVAPDLP